MTCNVCGDPKGIYRIGARQTLCNYCAKDTPKKASRESFDVRYWGAEAGNVPEGTKREFYSDYLSSTHTVDEYIKATTSEVE